MSEAHFEERLMVFVGSALRDLASQYSRGRSTDEVALEESVEAGMRVMQAESKGAEFRSRKLMLVVHSEVACGDLGRELRKLVAPLEGLIVPDVRTVVVGEERIRDFQLLADLLWSHVVDWLPAVDHDQEVVVERLYAAWAKRSMRIATLGMGLNAGAPQHVLTHIETQISDTIEPLRLGRLGQEGWFRSCLGGERGPSDSEFEQRMLREFEWRWRYSQWEEVYHISKSDMSCLREAGLSDSHSRMLMPRLWAAYLAEIVSGIADMAGKDRRELADYLEGVRRDYFYREDDHG